VRSGSQQKKVIKIIPFKFKVFQILTTRYFTILLLSTFIILWYPISIVITYFTGCPFQPNKITFVTPFLITYAVVLSVIYTFAICIWVKDLIDNRRVLLKNIRKPWVFFVLDDPYLFRIEFIGFVLSNIWSAIAPTALYNVLDPNRTKLWLRYLNTTHVQIILLFFIAGFPLLVTVIRERQQYRDR
jgi:hypothetical protein